MFDSLTRQAVRDSTITVLQGGVGVAATSTDETDRFAFVAVREGVYQVLAESGGYQPVVSGEVRGLLPAW